jgi:S-adenosylmethionine:tRNA ribosyltransferase-isomerase
VKTSDFAYHLPDELIAQQPLDDRAASRMMVVNRATGEIRHDQFRNFPTYIREGDLLVLNNTKVIPARIWSQKPNVELLLVENLGDNRWTTLVKPGHRAKVGAKLEFTPWFNAVVEGETDFGGRILRFTGDVDSYLQHHGAPPLPPYIERAATTADYSRYQTVFAQTPGAIAAPTAGLHFTPEILEELPHAFLTLHVGIGTFRPVKVENIEEHKMHAEKFSIPAETKAAIQQAKRVVAVGTTVVRALESVARSGTGVPPVRVAGIQKQTGETPVPLSLSAATGSTDIFIRPPFQFRVVGALLTNFHLPKSTARRVNS